ncbi:GNAT family N-acetyltransferase [Flammeovirga agarivorans]|uniref:GNAT family N-acetyltransferase n=1 Tax=Flammeovirga agarivorans TaxID=2726742 RepID=A0A7X8XYR4_9BACT|nr:GNAT family N-acetyltransferase [Flammeovirga agarivorans]NLR94472.1 GNAT family N-acetyltransferase [Flammeovirga agarivorans]
MKETILNYRTDSQTEEHKKLAYDIEFTAFKEAGGIYDERHAKLYGNLAVDMINDGSYSIIIEDVGHACYTPMKIDQAPHLKCYVLAPLAVLPGHQGKGFATKLMEIAESELKPDVVFVAGEKHHYGRRYSTPHKIDIPVASEMPLENWFARELTPGCLDGIESSTSISGPYSEPKQWSHPSEQFDE